MSVESFLASESLKKPRHFKDVAKKLLSRDEEELEDTRPWKCEDEIGADEWNGMKNTYKAGIFDELWHGRIVSRNQLILGFEYPSEISLDKIYNNACVDIEELLRRGIKYRFEDAVAGAVKILLRVPERAFTINEEFWRLMKTQLEDRAKNRTFAPYFDLAWKMRILAAYKVELTKDWKIIITDKPPAKLDTEIPKRPTRLKK